MYRPKPFIPKYEIRKCQTCQKEFKGLGNRFYCSRECKPKPLPFAKVNKLNRPDIVSGTVGTIGELIVSSKLLLEGWSVFRALSPSCFCDIVAIKGNTIRKIEVRTGRIYQTANGTTLTYSKKCSNEATEYAVYVPETGEVTYIPIVPNNTI